MSISMSNLADVLEVLPADQAVLVRGPHGIGKSQLVHALGKTFKCPVYDVRLSQMSEGDFLGLPKLWDPEFDEDGNLVKMGKTEFMPPDWYVALMEEPAVLLLDELNRAIPEVMQCSFQLILDRMVMGKHIHPDVRIVACVNASQHYQVNEMDPALLDRFAVWDVAPRLEDWVEWARGSEIDSSIVEFCAQNEGHWWHDPALGLEPGKVYPTPRSWERLHICLTESGLFDKPKDARFRFIAEAIVGLEAGLTYWDFVKNYDRKIDVEDLLNRYASIRKRIVKNDTCQLSTAEIGTLSDKIEAHFKKNKWTKRHAVNAARFLEDIQNGELAFALFSRLMNAASTPELQENLMLFHKHSRETMNKVTGLKKK